LRSHAVATHRRGESLTLVGSFASFYVGKARQKTAGDRDRNARLRHTVAGCTMLAENRNNVLG
jgi:hypothetical protein